MKIQNREMSLSKLTKEEIINEMTEEGWEKSSIKLAEALNLKNLRDEVLMISGIKRIGKRKVISFTLREEKLFVKFYMSNKERNGLKKASKEGNMLEYASRIHERRETQRWIDEHKERGCSFKFKSVDCSTCYLMSNYVTLIALTDGKEVDKKDLDYTNEKDYDL